jgi:hypothetical protein
MAYLLHERKSNDTAVILFFSGQLEEIKRNQRKEELEISSSLAGERKMAIKLESICHMSVSMNYKKRATLKLKL